MGVGEGGADDDEKFNDAVKFELEKERKEAKERMNEFRRRKEIQDDLNKKNKRNY